MWCLRCGRDAAREARFCPACGASLGPDAAPTAPYTPKHLTDRLLHSRDALSGERKHVTVLFVDLTSSVELSGRVDSEIWHGLMSAFVEMLAEGVHAFGGTVNQYTGDGVMALFGAPLAHEDHAARACDAALHLFERVRPWAAAVEQEHGFSLAARMGLHSGEVVVGRIGDDARMDYTAHGRTVGLAARMQQLAPADSAWLTDATARLVEDRFALRAVGEVEVRGAGEPVRVHTLEPAAPANAAAPCGPTASRFVGRGDELRALEIALDQALAGSARVVSIVAAAGIGKTRVCREFVARCRARGIRVFEARALPYGRSLPLVPVLELLRAYFGVGGQESDAAVRDVVSRVVTELDETLVEELPLLLDFLGVPDPERPAPRMDAEARQRRRLDLVRRLARARSRREPAVFVLEDLQWIDAVSVLYLEKFIDAIAGTRTLVIGSFRPEATPPWAERSYHTRLPLDPLPRHAIGELLSERLGGDQSLATLLDRIYERTRGNPFFAEEVVRSLAEQGALVGEPGSYALARDVHEVPIPDTVHSVLAARIDRLGPREKEVLQTAAILGPHFGESVLRRVLGGDDGELRAALGTLVAAELLQEEALFPDPQYAFQHPLTREVAYAGQLAARRKSVHGRVARAILELERERLDERAALLAHHFEQAGDRVEAAAWCRKAAHWLGFSDPGEALRLWRRMRDLLDDAPEQDSHRGAVARLGILGVGWRVGLSAEEAASAFEDGKALAERHGGVAVLAGLHAAYGQIRLHAGEVGEAVLLCREALRLVDKTEHPAMRPSVWVATLFAEHLAGNFEPALLLADRALAETSESPSQGAALVGASPYVWLLYFRGQLLVEMGRAELGAPELERAEKLARDQGELEMLGYYHGARVRLAPFLGDVEHAPEHARCALELAEKVGSSVSRAEAFAGLGLASLLGGRFDDSAAAYERALAIGRERRVGLAYEPIWLAELAEARLGVGDVHGARPLIERALELSEARGLRPAHMRALMALARLRRVEGSDAEEEPLLRARDLMRASGALGWEPLLQSH